MSPELPDLLEDDAWAEETEDAGEVDEVEAPRSRSLAVRWLLALVACLIVAAMILSVLPSGGR